MYKAFFKRFFDIVFSFLLIILISPLLIVISVLIAIKLGRPVIFKQTRPGKNEKVFTMYKFRTMTEEKDTNGSLLPDEIRLTKFGKKLRDWSLDELPELFNILKGDMSFIGPRPLLVQYLPLYNDVQRKRHLVKPGLTGLAQVNGRNALSWVDKFALDVQYVESVTFINDVSIFFKTIVKVLKKDNISSDTSATMEVFEGNESTDEDSTQ